MKLSKKLILATAIIAMFMTAVICSAEVRVDPEDGGYLTNVCQNTSTGAIFVYQNYWVPVGTPCRMPDSGRGVAIR